MMRPDPLRQRGLTLIEVLIALLLLAMGAAGLMTLQVRLRMAADASRHHDQGLRLARNELERWRWRPDAPAPALAWEGPDAVFDAEGLFATGAEALDQPAQDSLPLRAAHVRVTWTGRDGVRRSLWLDTLMPLTDPALSGVLMLPPEAPR